MCSARARERPRELRAVRNWTAGQRADRWARKSEIGGSRAGAASRGKMASTLTSTLLVHVKQDLAGVVPHPFHIASRVGRGLWHGAERLERRATHALLHEVEHVAVMLHFGLRIELEGVQPGQWAPTRHLSLALRPYLLRRLKKATTPTKRPHLLPNPPRPSPSLPQQHAPSPQPIRSPHSGVNRPQPPSRSCPTAPKPVWCALSCAGRYRPVLTGT